MRTRRAAVGPDAAHEPFDPSLLQLRAVHAALARPRSSCSLHVVQRRPIVRLALSRNAGSQRAEAEQEATRLRSDRRNPRPYQPEELQLSSASEAREATGSSTSARFRGRSSSRTSMPHCLPTSVSPQCNRASKRTPSSSEWTRGAAAEDLDAFVEALERAAHSRTCSPSGQTPTMD